MAKKSKYNNIPKYTELFQTVVVALKALGGSGTIEEINEKVYEIEKLSQEVLDVLHKDNENQSEIDYRLAWARTYLKKYGIIENSKRGVWALVNMNVKIEELDVQKIKESFKEHTNAKQSELIEIQPDNSEVEEKVLELDNWREELLHILYNISPAAFERLTQRLLRENGFTQVEVTGKVGDGGIDGKGIVKISGLLSFHIIFQCKRYKGSVTASQIRDFRGAMQGRADKGLFITTGSFTRDAVKEATRDGAPPIDLLDGEQLCEKLKEMQLGLSVELVEVVKIHKNWFDNL